MLRKFEFYDMVYMGVRRLNFPLNGKIFWERADKGQIFFEKTIIFLKSSQNDMGVGER